jgi:hypothetical protein
VHHCVHDEHGGVTDLCNLVALCRHHHGVAHRKGWSVRVDADGWAIFQSPTSTAFWGQRHGRQREGPPPDPLHEPTDAAERRHRRPAGGFAIVPGRYHRTEDPTAAAIARQIVLRRLADLPPMNHAA